MLRITLLVVLAILTLGASPARAQDRILRHEVIIHAPVEDLWAIWTTAEGWKKLGIAQAEVDFKVGGQIRTHYNPAGVLGDDGTIVNTILAFEPQRMLALKATAPRNAPPFIQEICKTGWSVMRFEPLSPSTTRLTLAGMGYGEGELYDQAYEFFDRGNAYTLQTLQQSFPAPAQAEPVQDLLAKLIGEWEFSNTRPDGSTFRSRTSTRALFGGKVLIATGLLGNASTMFHHSHFVASLDPVTGQYRLWNWNQSGDISTGEFTSPARDTLAFGWDTIQAKDGKRIAYSGEYIFHGDDAFDCIIYRPDADNPAGRSPMINVRYTRCAPGTPRLDVAGQTPQAPAP